MLAGLPEWNLISQRILGCCLAVHKVLGPGLLESVYEDCLAWEMSKKGLSYSRQHSIPILYDGRIVGDPLRLDFLVEETVILEVKAVEMLHPVFTAQVLSYLRLADKPIGLLVNFHSTLLRNGIHRLVLARCGELGETGENGGRGG